ncbi:MAG: hypothetical protein QOG85_401 [Gaiellaceae bacterium]|jgi:hypothetical protein|nr:hypothetical protein [Gaiellaceae bacterium]
MRRARLAILTALAILIIGVVPAAAGSTDWGTWTFSGHWTSWHGKFVDSHRVTGFVMGTRSLVKYNGITSFSIGGHVCKISSNHGTAYCYYLNIPANQRLDWKVTTRKPLKSAAGLVPCIQYAGAFHCRYGDG